jgi:hypothetical protein
VSVLADGEQRLVSYVEHRLARVSDSHQQVRRWIEAVMAQAGNPEAAASTRPFAINGDRLRARFPTEAATSRDALVRALEPAVRAAGGDERDARLVHDLVMARMHDALVEGRAPERKEVAHLVDFCLAGIGRS